MSQTVQRHCSSIVQSADSKLARMVGPATLHAMQDRFASLGQVTVCICTVRGELITEPTWGSPYSAMIGTSRLGRELFRDRLRELADSVEKKVPSVCHEGLCLYAATVQLGQTRLGMIVVGTRPPGPPPAAEIEATAAKFELDAQALADTVDHVTRHTGATPDATHQFADTMADTLATMYEQAQRIAQQLADLSVVHDLATRLAGSANLDEILSNTVNRVVEVMPVKACAIRLLNARTGELVVKAVCNLSEQYLAKGPVVLDANPIDAAAFAGEAVYVEDARTDPRIRYPENARREGLVSGLCVPLTYREETVGVLRVYTARIYRFSDSETSLLRSLGSQAAAAIVNARLHEGHVRDRIVRRQVKSAAQIQRRMLPASPPATKHFEFAGVYKPTLEVGGDFYDYLELPDGRIGVCVADVVGKGIPAALMMASVRSALHVSACNDPNISRTLEAVNRHMCRETLPSEFATLVYGAFSPDGRSFTYCNAGHIPPILLRNGVPTDLTGGSLVIGVFPDERFQSETIPIEVGDVLVLVTDGIIEAFDFQDRQYSMQRLRASIQRHAQLSASQMAREILWDVHRFVGLSEQSDDITIMVVRRI
ncbi:MAG: SpoIIE family protein phosphatase [Phycisphaerae bacterium]